MEQFVILIIIALISLVNWLMEKSAEHKKLKELERQRELRGDANPMEPLEEEWVAAPLQPTELQKTEPPTAGRQMRELYEALGLPSPEEDSTPPLPAPVLVKKSSPPPIPNRAQPSPQIILAPLREEPFHEGPAKKTKPHADFQAMKEAAARFAKSQEAAAKPVGGSNSLRDHLLKNPESLRDAIVLREILGPPKALDS